MNRLVTGALAGCLATVPMTATMYSLHRRLPNRQRYPLPPREITQTVLHKADMKKHLRSQQIGRVSLLAHFAYGAATGALYATAFNAGHSPTYSAARGATYGVAVWGMSYLGWIPAAHILKPATQHPARRNALMLAAHLVWGSSTDWLCRAMGRLSEARQAEATRQQSRA